MGNDIQRVQQLGDSIRQLREDMDALSKIAPQVEKMIALSSTLESTTKNINENMSKVSKTIQDVDEKVKKAKEIIDTVNEFQVDQLIIYFHLVNNQRINNKQYLKLQFFGCKIPGGNKLQSFF